MLGPGLNVPGWSVGSAGDVGTPAVGVGPDGLLGSGDGVGDADAAVGLTTGEDDGEGSSEARLVGAADPSGPGVCAGVWQLERARPVTTIATSRAAPRIRTPRQRAVTSAHIAARV
jgi:hypothetical protein